MRTAFFCLVCFLGSVAVTFAMDDLGGNTSNPTKIQLHIDTKAHILSFFDQKDLLNARVVSKEWWEAVDKVCKPKPLNLSERDLSKEDCKVLANGPFSSFVLKFKNLGNEKLSILARSSKLTQLKFNDKKILKEEVKDFASANFQFLEILDLSFTHIEHEGVETLFATFFPKLKVLDLEYSDLEGKEVKNFSSTNLPLLENLNLSASFVSNEAAKNIFLLPFPNLTMLNLSSNEIGYEVVENINPTNLPSIKKLGLSSNYITNKEMEKLNNLHPWLKMLSMGSS